MRIIKATYGPSESGSTGTVIGGTILAAPSSTPRGSSAHRSRRDRRHDRELDRLTSDDPAAATGSAGVLMATSTARSPSATPPR